MYRRLLVIFSTVLPFLTASAQQRQCPPVRVNVRVNYVNEQAAPAQLRVQLVTLAGAPMTEAQTDSRGQVEFMITPGVYEIRVSGAGIETATGTRFQTVCGDTDASEFVQVRPRQSDGGQAAPAGASVSAAALNLPKKARDEYEKGNKDVRNNHWESARKHFEKTIELAPKFAAAQNNLGVTCDRLRDAATRAESAKFEDCARKAFQTALDLDPKLTTAYLNLARLEMKAHNFPQVKTLVQKYLTSSPEDPDALTLLAECELVTGNYPSALANAQKVNAMPQAAQYPIAHYVAGRALEQQQRPQEAATEYQVFLKAQPNAPQAANARAALNRLGKPNPNP